MVSVQRCTGETDCLLCGGVAPDVTQVSVAFVRGVRFGYFDAATKYVERDGQAIWRTCFSAHAMRMSHAMPHDIISSGIVYDIDAFLQA